MIRNAEGQWSDATYHQDGSYLVFTVTSGDQHFALVSVPSGIPLWMILAAALVVLLPIPIAISIKKKKAKKAAEQTA